jgi:hypothetical protein
MHGKYSFFIPSHFDSAALIGCIFPFTKENAPVPVIEETHSNIR